MRQIFLFSVVALFLISCEVKPAKIEYGSDACHYCDMTIVDPQFASQVVTSKGKAYKYDAIECMVHSLQEHFPDVEMSYTLVADFKEPGELIDASSSYYLVSENLPSPMGGNLSGYKTQAAAKSQQSDLEGKVYSWEDIQSHLKK